MRRAYKLMVVAVVALTFVLTSAFAPRESVVVGSKLFTEAVILGEVATLLAASNGAEAVHRRQLGGTRVLWNALLNGDIDVYAEYTGTLYEEILQTNPSPQLAATLRDSLGVEMTGPLGFNNTYALGVRAESARNLGLSAISDLSAHPELRFGFSNEFVDRNDGWPLLRSAYRLPQQARGMDHDLAYRGLAAGDIDVMDLYTTDAEIAYYNIAVLEDDARVFPTYNAIYVFRADLATRAPAFVDALRALSGTIPESLMVSMNRSVKIDGESESMVAQRYLASIGIAVDAGEERSRLARIALRTREHLVLVGISLFFAILVSIPLGIWAARSPRVGVVILGLVGVLYTIPSLALLAFMIPLIGIGGPPAMVALFLYSLLPIVRNTHAGLTGIAPRLSESAEALGLSAFEKLRHVELPLSARSIVAGIKTAAVINVGTATLGALIGAGGYGQPILTGIRLDDVGLILEGAVPAALLALLVQGLFSIKRYH